jgi:SSS family solute:Na+ symporter
MIGMLCGFGTELYIWQFTRVPWTWYVVIGTLMTFIVGYASSMLFPDRAQRSDG